MSEGLTKKQFKELRKLEKMQSHNLEQKNSTVKWIALSLISAMFLILFVGVIVVAKNKNKPTTDSSGALKFADNGHQRALTSNGKDATVSANPAQKLVTLVEYGDLQCPACKAYHPIVNQLLASFPDQIKLIFKNFPLTQVHRNAMAAAIAAEAVGVQGKYFEFFDMAYDKQDEWSELDDPQSKFEQYAKSLGLDVVKFKKDQKDPAIAKLISDESDEGGRNGVTGTPTFFVDGVKIENPTSIEAFKKVITDELNKLNGNAPIAKPTEKTKPLNNPSTPSDKLPLQQ